MYDASPENTTILDFRKTKLFLEQFDWDLINAFGFYGGEPSIDTELYDKFISLVPAKINRRFIITNGTWSKQVDDTVKFLNWCAKNRFHIIISSTPEHIKYQDRGFIVNLAMQSGSGIELKEPDEIHAQGRAKGRNGVVSDCKLTCRRTDRNIRLGLKPDGNIVFQNCHGEYHIIQSYNEPFDGILDKAQQKVVDCLKDKKIN
jgi:hypothetical protein